MAAASACEHVRTLRDPIAERDRVRRATSGIPSFGEMADQFIKGIEQGF